MPFKPSKRARAEIMAADFAALAASLTKEADAEREAKERAERRKRDRLNSKIDRAAWGTGMNAPSEGAARRPGRKPGSRNKHVGPIELTGENIRYYFSYDATSGKMYRAVTVVEKRYINEAVRVDPSIPYKDKVRNVSVRREGAEVGKPSRTNNWNNPEYGAYLVEFRGEMYRFYALAYLWMTGQWPDGPPVYLNGDRWDHAWSNLQW